jgi:CBS domain-containing protein
MRAHGIAALVVESGGAIMGIVSERDIVSALSRFGEHALSMSVKEILTLAIITVTPGDSIKRAMRLMTRHRVRQLPVMAEGRLAGIVSVGDVVKQRLDDLEAESNVLRDVYIAAH